MQIYKTLANFQNVFENCSVTQYKDVISNSEF